MGHTGQEVSEWVGGKEGSGTGMLSQGRQADHPKGCEGPVLSDQAQVLRTNGPSQE